MTRAASNSQGSQSATRANERNLLTFPLHKTGALSARQLPLSLNLFPIGVGSIVLVNATIILAAPVPTLALVILRGVFELVLGQIDAIATEVGVVFQGCPRHWIVIFAHAEKATKTQDRIHYLAADLVDHHALDRTDLFLVGTIRVNLLI